MNAILRCGEAISEARQIEFRELIQIQQGGEGVGERRALSC